MDIDIDRDLKDPLRRSRQAFILDFFKLVDELKVHDTSHPEMSPCNRRIGRYHVYVVTLQGHERRKRRCRLHGFLDVRARVFTITGFGWTLRCCDEAQREAMAYLGIQHQ